MKAFFAFLVMILAMPWVSMAQEAPSLPSGLEGDAGNDAPALPSGLADDSSEEGPALPAGLGGGPGDETAPALPVGLGETTSPELDGSGENGDTGLKRKLPFPVYGFVESRAGIRLQEDDAMSSDATIGELRLQLQTEKRAGGAQFEFMGDFTADGVVDGVDFDLRRLKVTFSPFSSLDVELGRQILTWGTGDMLFLNDLFPKDWQSYFVGRDDDYLKAPSDAVRVGWFSDWFNVNLVYTPQFAHDRYIKGERISYWDPMRQAHSGQDNQVDAAPPSDWFEDDEWALRLYRNIGSTEVALYGYDGYWKSPGGQRLIPMQARFPKLRVYGASVRGVVAGGIANAEVAYYDSYQDRSGGDPFVNNSEFRLLVGYERELAKEFTGSVQYYLEHMMDWDAYMDSRIFLMPTRDKDRHVFTARLTRQLMNQNLTLSFFGYYSPSDGDAFLRPKVNYKATDQLILEAGGNIFVGESDTTFFGQFENNTNVYVSARYAF